MFVSALRHTMCIVVRLGCDVRMRGASMGLGAMRPLENDFSRARVPE
jgi:hypothetical protein